tara:strand:+ start:346 stop:543 length:198 start_codon:yes stop_codon:yes gene_type:complete
MIAAYTNMNIDDMPSETAPEKDTGGIMLRKKGMDTTNKLDMSQPAIRMAVQMKPIRDARNKLNGV